MAKFPAKKKKDFSYIRLFVFLFLASVGYYCIPSYYVATLFSYVSYPFLKMQQSIVEPCRRYLIACKEFHELEKTIDSLEQERDALAARLIESEVALEYAGQTEELVAFKERYACKNAALVNIFTKNISEKTNFFLVDAGSNRGIVPGMVAVYQNQLIGKVSEVYPLYSKVVLIIDRTCKVAAYCLATKATGIHVGRNQVSATGLDYVSRLTPTPHSGDLVISSGEGLVFPKGFALGCVTEFGEDDLLYTITVRPLCNFHSLSYCYLIERGDDFALR